MLALATAALFHVAIFAAGEADTYAEAHRVNVETGKPLVVMVGTDWCGPCQQMKRTVLPQVRQHGLLGKVAFATVNADREGPLARRLTGGGPVPQLVMYRRTARGWVHRKLVGGQSVESVEKFISEAIAMDDDAMDGADAKDDAPPASKDETRTSSVSRGTESHG